MGFFIKEDISHLQEAPKRAAPKREARPVTEHERGCEACPLHDTWPRLTSPCIPLRGNPEGDILVIGEAPGEDEDMQGEVFVGKTGQFLRRHIPHRHLDRLAFTNAARCRPPGNRLPTGLEMHCCSVHLEEDIRRGKFKAILLVGGAALGRFIPPAEASITQVHGLRFPVEVAGRVMWAFSVFHPSFVERTGGTNSAQWPCFNADLKAFFSGVDKWRDPVVEKISPTDVVCSSSEDEVRSLVDRMAGVLGIDIETSKLKPYEQDARIITASISDGDTTVAFPCDHPQSPNGWGTQLLLEVAGARRWVGHQSQFEFTWMVAEARRLGLEGWESAEFDDSMALSRQLHCRTGVNGLGISSRLILGINVKSMTPVDARRIMAYSLAEVLPYNGLDAWASAKIQRRAGKVNDWLHNHFMRTSRAFALMELEGLDIDVERAQALKSSWSEVAAQAERDAVGIYEAKAFVRERQQEFNVGNPQHVGIALTQYGRLDLPKTESGKSISTDDSILGPLADKNPLVKAVLTYREATKHISTYIDPVLAVPATYPDGRIHPAYTNGMFTHTIRSSSERPNIQNWPKRKHKEIRGMIHSRPGHVLMACDSGQIQARVFGMASRDRALIQSFIDHDDIHKHWMNRAIEVYPPYLDRLREETNATGVSQSVIRYLLDNDLLNRPDDLKVFLEEEKDLGKLLKAGRNVIKYDFVFASFFGQIAKSCAEKTGIPLHLVNELLEEFWGGYPEAHKWLKARRAEYRDTGSVHLLTGQCRHGVMPGNECIITAIQGGEAELVLSAVCDLAEASIRERDPYLMPRLVVHDDITIEVPDDDEKIEYYMDRVTDVMNKVRFPWQIVPLTTEVQIGRSWDALNEIAVIEGQYNR